MLKRIGVFLSVTFLASSTLLAQTSGTILGHINDTTGAVVPGVTITLTNTGTNTSRTTLSTSDGDYTFPDVPPGVYSVEATHPGFKAETAANVQLQVQQSLTQNFTLQVGEVTQTVSVSAAAALLQTQNSSLGTVVSSQTLAEAPVNNRNYLNLAALSANANVVSPTQGQAGARLGGARANETISVGGSRIMFNHYTLDGINNSDVDFNTFVVQPSIDAIQEMKVQNGVYPAQYGYNQTQVNVVSKSGSNNYHGTAFYFLRNNYADALGYNYFYPTPLPKAFPYKYNDYGFVLSGPISIPHVFNGKNRFFFMVNDEWYSRISFSNTANTQPTAAVLGGDFSQYKSTATGSVVPIYDPATGNPDGTGRTQFPGNVIPASRIDPTSLKYIQLFDVPAQNSLFQNNYTYLTSSRDTHDGFNVRGDYYLSSKQQFAFRFSNGLETNPTAQLQTAGGTTGSNIITSYYQYMGSHTWTPSPTIVNVATFGYTNFYNSLGLFSQGVNNAVGKLGIPNLQPGIPATWGIPSLGFTGDIYSGLGDSTDGPYVTKDPDISINDNITWVRGKHAFSFGFQYERQTFNELGNQFSRGGFTTQANATAELSSPGKLVSKTGSAFADFLLGQLYTSVYAVQIAQADYKRNVEAFYFDDNYKFTPKVTISAGLRYELTPPWRDQLGNEFIVDLQTNNSPVTPFVSGPEPQNLWPFFRRQGTCSDPYQGVNIRWVNSTGGPVSPAPQCANGQFPNSLMQTAYDNWAPRLGIAYTPNNSWVIRTGFGMYYDNDTANARFDVARNLAGRVTTTSGGGTPGLNTINWGNAVAGGGTANIPPPYTYANAYRHKSEYSEVWLFDVQKQIGQDWQLEAGYLGSKTDHLYGFRNANFSVPYGLLGAAGYNANGSPKSILQRTPYPNNGVIQLVHDLGNANYNAFTFQVNKRFSNGFNIISSYTYSKSLDDTSGIRTQSSELFPQNDLCISCEYGPSDFDVKHRVVGSLIYNLPFGAGMMYAPSSKIVDAVIGGWQLSVLGTLQTGQPFNMGYNDNNASTNTISGGTPATRPNYVSGQPFFAPNKRAGSSGQWVNLAAFPEPAPGFLGSTSRNMLYSPGYQNFDMSIGKRFNMPYNEHHQLQIRLDAFNALNHTNFGNPTNNKYVNSSTGGKITTSNAIPGSANQGGRELELGARYTF